MTWIQALVLAVVEGISEFLPISSTGHLILTNRVLGIEMTEFVKSFEIAIQLGAILAVVYLYRNTLTKNWFGFLKVGVSFVPTMVVGFGLYSIIKTYLLGNVEVTLWMLVLGGAVLIGIEKWHREKAGAVSGIERVSYKQAVWLGLFQSLAVVPGVSRSAATIIGGLVLGLKRSTAVEYSFLLAVPTMTAATGLDLLETGSSFNMEEVKVLAIGFIGSFLVALLAVKFFIRYIQNHSFVAFGVYRIVLGVVFWLVVVR